MSKARNNISSVNITELFDNNAVKSLEKLIQVIPKEMLDLLKSAAELKGISLDVEVLSRLTATIVEPNAFGLSPMLNSLLNQNHSNNQIMLEIELRRRAWACLYEMDKLRLYIELEDKLPKKFKESFTLIDFEKEAKILREQKRKRDQENGE